MQAVHPALPLARVGHLLPARVRFRLPPNLRCGHGKTAESQGAWFGCSRVDLRCRDNRRGSRSPDRLTASAGVPESVVRVRFASFTLWTAGAASRWARDQARGVTAVAGSALCSSHPCRRPPERTSARAATDGRQRILRQDQSEELRIRQGRQDDSVGGVLQGGCVGDRPPDHRRRQIGGLLEHKAGRDRRPPQLQLSGGR